MTGLQGLLELLDLEAPNSDRSIRMDTCLLANGVELLLDRVDAAYPWQKKSSVTPVVFDDDAPARGIELGDVVDWR